MHVVSCMSAPECAIVSRRYVKSRSDQQLRGQPDWNNTASQCQPELYLPNTSLPIDPCGLIAWSYFNDTYQVAYHKWLAA